MSGETEGREQEFPEEVIFEDVEWLFSLSDSELNMLISLKELAIKRAKHAGRGDLADRFNLRMLRALGVVLLEYLKERIENESIFPDAGNRMKLLHGFNFLPSDCEVNFGFKQSIEDNKCSNISTSKRKRMRASDEEAPSCKKQKPADSSA